MLTFGSGNLYGINTAANSTPRKLGNLQDVAFDISYTMKELRGQGQFAVDLRRGSGKITGKAKFATINGAILNDLFFAQTATTGLLQSAFSEAWTIPASPFMVTAANANTFDTDLGVIYTATGLPLTKVASGPTTGQYAMTSAVQGATCSYATNVMTCTVAPTTGAFAVGQTITAAGVAAGTTITTLGTGTGGTGTYNLSTSPGTIAAEATTAGTAYLFAAADVGLGVLIDYLYTSATGGTRIAMSNQLMGTTPTFMGVFSANVGGKIATLKLNACVSNKLAIASKLEDYAIPEFDFEAMCDASGNIGNFSVAA